MSAQVAADLRAAAEVLRRDGWTQGRYHTKTGGGFCHCAEGAVEVATGSWVAGAWTFDSKSVGREEDALLVLGDYLASTGERVECIPDFNDAPGRTADEVIAALEAAATAAETDQ